TGASRRCPIVTDQPRGQPRSVAIAAGCGRVCFWVLVWLYLPCALKQTAGEPRRAEGRTIQPHGPFCVIIDTSTSKTAVGTPPRPSWFLADPNGGDDMVPPNQQTALNVQPIRSQTDFTVIAGPCAVEELETMLACAREVQKAGGSFFRAGAYKPRTNPRSFQGLGQRGLEILATVREMTGMPVVT